MKCQICWGTGQTKNHAVLGKIARRVRENRGQTQRQAALRLGITPSHLSYLEKGKRRWRQELYRKAVGR